jgi:glycosyltransferase involved in cell wall biosynthesis
MKVLLVADNASKNFSGESALPLFYFDLFIARGLEVMMLCHSRCRDELRQRYINDDIYSNIFFIEDTKLQKTLFYIGKYLPFIIRDRIIGQIIYILTQLSQKSISRSLVKRFSLQIVFQPVPISPVTPSAIYDCGVPVVIGPMCGGMEFPPAFSYLESKFEKISSKLARILAGYLNLIIPGKKKAQVLLVSNERTASVLPKGYLGKLYYVIESGVDLKLFKPRTEYAPMANQVVRVVYMARFVDQKGIPYLVEAFSRASSEANIVLELIGNGELFEETQAQVKRLGIEDKVNFHGWMQIDKADDLIRKCDIYMVPAIRDCGGCAQLEAMAIGLPVIAANWAGPGQYTDESSGILVDVDTVEGFINGLAQAIVKLSNSPELRIQLGQGAKQRVRSDYLDWDSKVDRVIEIFKENI